MKTDRVFLVLGLVWLLAGMALGEHMGHTQDHGQMPTHAHMMLVGGVLIALPAVISLLIVNLAFGVMSRSATQLNVFSLGFPFSLVFGLIILWFSLQGWMPQFDRFSGEFIDIVSAWLI